jgi:hypothetical protein
MPLSTKPFAPLSEDSSITGGNDARAAATSAKAVTINPTPRESSGADSGNARLTAWPNDAHGAAQQ